MKSIHEKIMELNKLVLSGKPMEAFEKFYHQDVVMQENENEPVVGKGANRQRETDFFNKASGFSQNARLLDIALGQDLTMVKWHYDYTHTEWGKKKYTQVSVQHWRDGQIIKEQFFYGN